MFFSANRYWFGTQLWFRGQVCGDFKGGQTSPETNSFVCRSIRLRRCSPIIALSFSKHSRRLCVCRVSSLTVNTGVSFLGTPQNQLNLPQEEKETNEQIGTALQERRATLVAPVSHSDARVSSLAGARLEPRCGLEILLLHAGPAPWSAELVWFGVRGPL